MVSVIDHLLARAALGSISTPGGAFNRCEPCSGTSAPRDTLHGIFLCCTSEPLTSQHELEPQEEQELKARISFLGYHGVKVMWVGPGAGMKIVSSFSRSFVGRRLELDYEASTVYFPDRVPSLSFHKGC